MCQGMCISIHQLSRWGGGSGGSGGRGAMAEIGEKIITQQILKEVVTVL